MRQPVARITAVIAAGAACCAMLSGCNGSRSGRNHASASPSAAPPKLGTSVRDLEQFAGVTLPSDATDTRISARRNQNDDAVYLARFSTSAKNAEAFCSGNGLGGSLPWLKPLDEKTRQRFGIAETTQKRPRNCRASARQDPRVQREVIVVFPRGNTAVVHLLAYAVPSR